MIEVAFRVVAPDKVEKLRSWMAEAQQRKDDVRATFVQEGVRHERAYLLETPEQTILVYAMELENLAAAHAAFESSELAIDKEHRAVMDEVIAEKLEPELLYDVQLSTPKYRS